MRRQLSQGLCNNDRLCVSFFAPIVTGVPQGRRFVSSFMRLCRLQIVVFLSSNELATIRAERGFCVLFYVFFYRVFLGHRILLGKQPANCIFMSLLFCCTEFLLIYQFEVDSVGD